MAFFNTFCRKATLNQKLTLIYSLTIVFLFMSGCSSRVAPSSDSSKGSDTGNRVVAISEQMIGSPYSYGGDSPEGFDCSGLVRYVYRQVGIAVPHSSRMLYQQSINIPINKLQPGDLLFFRIDYKNISHVGIFTEGLSFIHAPSNGKKVKISRLDSTYWAERLAGAGRFR